MATKVLNGFDVWITSQGVKSRTRLRSVDNVSLEGVKRLRELIIEFAIRGKLVPQDPKEEPAKVLLERISQIREELIEADLIRRPKKIAEIFESQFLKYKLPKGWEWAPLDSIAPMSLCDGDWIETKDQDTNGSIRLIQLADVGEGFFIDKSDKYINEDTFKRLKCTELEEGDVLIARLPSPIGRACIFPGLNQKSITVVDIAILRPLDTFHSPYIVNAINSKTFRGQVESFGKGVTRFRISTGNLKSFLLPLPPMAEQHRIVAKVDELMALCDMLEQRETEHLKSHQLLVETLLGTLTRAADSKKFQQAWDKLYEHFDDLFTTEDSIDQLKQAILQWAVMGRLVEQNANDEPASVLLKRIEREMESLVGERKKKKIMLREVSEEEKSFRLPTGWEWARLGSFSEIKGGKRLPNGHSFSSVQTPHVYIQVTNLKNGTITTDNLNCISTETRSEISKYTINKEDLYITIAGTIGDVGIVPEDFDGMNLTENAAKIIFRVIDKFWLQKVLTSELARKQYLEKTKQVAQPKLALHRIGSTVIPVPPLSEQHRIVAKVDELFALCDRLKEGITESQTIANQIANSTLTQMT